MSLSRFVVVLRSAHVGADDARSGALPRCSVPTDKISHHFRQKTEKAKILSTCGVSCY